MTTDRIQARPEVPWDRTVVYEAHVRGMTMLHESVPVDLRGTYAGFAHPAVTDHLRRLGVTTVELLPIFAHTTEPALAARGMTNYWGYNTLDYFAPHAAYAAGDDPFDEFRTMVDDLHTAGIEVVLDVVYNHTSPELLDPSWYRSEDGLPVDFTGCGNTLDTSKSEVQEFVLESLRFWAMEGGVDGFRFDLASAMARDDQHELDTPGELFDRIAADPVLGRLKLIAEPWDAAGDGYALGAFGPPYAEWNDRFRDDLRDFWRGAGDIRTLATRLTGSADHFTTPLQSVNFVTAHDGFSLRDVVSYADKHNEANGEEGRDGHGDNRSDNCGVEGETDDPAIIACRQNRAAAFLTSLLLSRGVPMIRMGDEFGHTQSGNNNAYCQDNTVTWIPWKADAGWDLCELIGQLVGLRSDFTGSEFPGPDDVTWFGADGEPLSEDDWDSGQLTGIGMNLGERALWLDAAEQSVWIREADVTRQVTPVGLEP